MPLAVGYDVLNCHSERQRLQGLMAGSPRSPPETLLKSPVPRDADIAAPAYFKSEPC